MDEVRVGNRSAPISRAREFAEDYLQKRDQYWSYPAYDGYRREEATGPLVDADLLAPVLLNVQHIGLPTYYHLLAELPYFQDVLDQLAPELSLLDASQDELFLMGKLFAGIDAKRLPGARLTTVAKILHRKRPALIPLYDNQVGSCYQTEPDPPIPYVKGRPLRDFFPLFAAAVRKDLADQLDFWQEIAQLAPDPPITPLRAFDIVAWWLGGPGRTQDQGDPR